MKPVPQLREPSRHDDAVTDKDRTVFYGGLAGITFIGLTFGGYAIFAAELPKVGAPAEEWAAFYEGNTNQIVLGVTIAAIGMGFFLWFIASLRRMLAHIEGPNGVATTIAFGGGLIAFVYVVVAQSGVRAAALRAGSGRVRDRVGLPAP
jgi:hypothetical protein